MRYLKRPQIITISVAILAIVLLLLLPRTKEVESKDEIELPVANSSNYEELSMQKLSSSELEIYKSIQAAVQSANDPLQKIENLDSLSNFWEAKGDKLLAADALSDVAEIIEDKPSYFIAGDKYFEAFSQLTDERKVIALKKAIQSYEFVLEKNPEDLEAMTSLAVCYVEGSAVLGEAPMKGIGMLKDVLARDPENINALINLGYFSTKSGQYAKAIERFEQVLKIDPDFSDAYLYLSETYLQMEDNEEAANYLEQYKRFVIDPVQKEQLDVYIEKIRNNNI